MDMEVEGKDISDYLKYYLPKINLKEAPFRNIDLPLISNHTIV